MAEFTITRHINAPVEKVWGVLDDFGVEMDDRGNCASSGYATSKDGVFVAGDMRRGQSLVVWAISEGRECARAVDEYLTGRPSLLAAKDLARSDIALAP